LSLFVNELRLTAAIVEVSALRYTPAGIEAIDLVLSHQSEQTQMGGQRQVNLNIKALAFGDVAQTLLSQSLGASFLFQGFLTNARQVTHIRFQIQSFHPI
jgi:primosomal replication protein N